MTSKERNNSPAKGPTSNKPKGINENMALQPVTPEPTNGDESPLGYFSGMSPRMAIEVARGRWYPGRGDVSGGSATVPKPTIKAVAKEPEPEHEKEEEDEEGEEEEKAHEPQICHWGACRQTYTGVDGAADLVYHISEDHVGHDEGYNPRCDFGSCGWTRKDRRDLLMAHVVRHIHGYKPLQCDQCDYSTKELRELVRHKKRRDHQ
ncbi:MAG: Alcohol oxidase [Aureobasidium pullulans]|nr:MAG: Alcohol oxidase [Aureobasidium pullulans]